MLSRFKKIQLGEEKFERIELLGSGGFGTVELVRKNDKPEDEKLISLLSKNFTDIKIYAACEGSRLDHLKKHKNLAPLHTVDELEKIL